MCKAAKKGDIDTIRVLIENGVDPNESDYDGRTCLHLAACEDQLGVIHFLLGCHRMPGLTYVQAVEVNPVDTMGGTPLDDAIRHGRDVVERLLRKTGGVCFDDPEGMKEAREKQRNADKEKFKKKVIALANNAVAKSKETRMVTDVSRYVDRLMSYTQLVNTDVAELKKELALVIVSEKEYSKLSRKREKEKTERTKKLKSLQSRVQEVLSMLSEWQDHIEDVPTISPTVLRSFAEGRFAAVEGPDDDTLSDTMPATPPNAGRVGEMDKEKWKAYCVAQVKQLSDIIRCLGEML
jgi:vacuolar-type H+-ATPase subunit I/STV1